MPGPLCFGGDCPWEEEDEDEDEDEDDDEDEELVDVELELDELVIVTGGVMVVVEVVVVVAEEAHDTFSRVLPGGSAGIGTWDGDGALTVSVSI